MLCMDGVQFPNKPIQIDSGMGEVRPAWLDAAFLEMVLRAAEGDAGLRVEGSLVRQAVAAGDNFASLLLRVTASVSGSGPRHLIVKALPPGDARLRETLVAAGLFARERAVYDALPAMCALWPGPVAGLAPRCLPAVREDTLVLEDLRPLGYRMVDRRRQLDAPHCRVALRNLARFHALSAALHRRLPRVMETFREGLYTPQRRDCVHAFLGGAIAALAQVVDTWDGYGRFGDKLRHLADTAVDRIIDVVKPDPNTLCVLNHGDFWINNILFRYHPDTGDVVDARFVDFQLSRFSSPALDLQYLVFTSVQEDVRQQHLDSLIAEYHAALEADLRRLGCDQLLITLDELRAEMHRRAFFGLVTACTYLGTVLAEPGQVSNLDLENGMECTYSGARFRAAFQNLLLHFESCNLL